MGKTAFLFPGQGAQTVGMATLLLEQLPAARELFARAASILGYDLAKLCCEGPQEQLDSTVIAQPALFVTALAALEKLRQDRPEVVEQCQATAGLSLGEYTALVFAGVMDFETGLKVVNVRGQAMQAASDAVASGMVSLLGLDREQVETICREAREQEILQVANLLCPGNIAVSGHLTACARAGEKALAAGAMKVIPLAVAGAFHTPLMQPAVERLAAAVADAPLKPARIPLVSNVDAQPHTNPDEIRQLLVKQICSPVLWEDSIRALQGLGCDSFWEVGPGRVLRGLLKRIDRKASCEGVLE